MRAELSQPINIRVASANLPLISRLRAAAKEHKTEVHTMGMTMTQKILAAHCGEAAVTAGQLINAKLDIVLGNDITTPVAINEFEKAGFDSVFDKTRVNIVLDHFVPIRTSRAQRSPSSAASLPTSTTFSTSTMWARWALNMPCCPKRAS